MSGRHQIRTNFFFSLDVENGIEHLFDRFYIVRLGVWCSKKSVDPAPWIQVDFGYYLYVSGLIIQGRAQYNQYVRNYELALSGDGKTWEPVTEVDGTPIRVSLYNTMHLKIAPSHD